MLYPDCKDNAQLKKRSKAFPMPISAANEGSLSSFRCAKQNDSAICPKPTNADLQLDSVDDSEKKGKVHLKKTDHETSQTRFHHKHQFIV